MMTLTHYGFREWGTALLMAMLIFAFGWFIGGVFGWVICVFAAVLWLAVALFFRNPKRTAPDDGTLLVSPADGVVRDVDEVDFAMPPFSGRALRIGIFLSVLDVHVNRAPFAWRIVEKFYKAGRFLDARDPKCASENEAMTLSGFAEYDGGEFPMAVRQISGAIARRIVCPPEAGAKFERGEVYGMIKFGSRTELYIPIDAKFEVLAAPGDRVRGGVTPLVKVKR
ncbi:MAG: phosphatidylserine decarboxylase [Victivallaceae bacterium]|nr:phosphatidylserine decarboxylase [Victivallaceae bacterium]